LVEALTIDHLVRKYKGTRRPCRARHRRVREVPRSPGL